MIDVLSARTEIPADRLGFYLLLAVVCVLLLAGILIHLWLTVPLGLEEPVVVTVQRGVTGHQVGQLLVRKGVLRSTLPFRVALWMTGSDGALRWGTVQLQPPVSMGELLRRLRSKRPYLIKVRLLEGWPSWRIFRELERQLDLSYEGFERLHEDSDFLRLVGVPADNLEGYLFPDTYYVAGSAGHREVLRQLVRRFHEVARSIRLRERARQHDMSLDEAVRLASLIEREAQVEEERPLVSAVFHNRLDRGWPLQADPTLLFMARDYQSSITYDLMERDHPYNTYERPGLPPGPICSPGRGSLEASVSPADTDYLYFVAKGDGTHVFSHTQKNHNRAVNRYQR